MVRSNIDIGMQCDALKKHIGVSSTFFILLLNKNLPVFLQTSSVSLYTRLIQSQSPYLSVSLSLFVALCLSVCLSVSL